MKNKKVTYKELKQRLDFMFLEYAKIKNAVDYTHTLLLRYIDCNKDSKKLIKFLEKETKNDEQTLRDSDGESGGVKKGNKSVKKSKPKVKKTIK